ncbi:MAG: hypothetical protein ABI658_31995, partial [Acidimicrobiales bacterium]
HYADDPSHQHAVLHCADPHSYGDPHYGADRRRRAEGRGPSAFLRLRPAGDERVGRADRSKGDAREQWTDACESA